MHSKSKVFEKNLLYQRILLDAFTVHERVFVPDTCEVQHFAHSYI